MKKKELLKYKEALENLYTSSLSSKVNQLGPIENPELLKSLIESNFNFSINELEREKQKLKNEAHDLRKAMNELRDDTSDLLHSEVQELKFHDGLPYLARKDYYYIKEGSTFMDAYKELPVMATLFLNNGIEITKLDETRYVYKDKHTSHIIDIYK